MTEPEPISEQCRNVLRFWFDELTPEDWFKVNESVDRQIQDRFGGLYERLSTSLDPAWESDASHALAAVIVLDQFPRNMFRGTPRAFATDSAALALAKRAIDIGFDTELDDEQCKFLYMPFQHAEDLADQNRSLELFARFDERTMDFARRHQEIVERFGRFPHRNAILGRPSTPEEEAFLEEPNSSF